MSTSSTTSPRNFVTLAVDDDQSALRFAGEHGDAALCTIVGIDGSFSRQLGAQLAVGADGATVGSLADGCLERELASQAGMLRGQSPQVLRFGKGSPFIDFRLPCGSGLDILVDLAPDSSAVCRAIKKLDARRPAEIVLPQADEAKLQVRRYVPALRMLVFGGGPEANWLERVACGAGFACTVVRPGEGLSLGQAPTACTADRWTAVVLLFHDHEWERGILDWALSTDAFYIGAIGGEVARANRIEILAGMGWGAAAIARVKGPVGLIPQARDARVLGISIVSEVVGTYQCLRPRFP